MNFFAKLIELRNRKKFLKLISKHFPPQHKLHKILNRNSIKISYSCMPKHENNSNRSQQETIGKEKLSTIKTMQL